MTTYITRENLRHKIQEWLHQAREDGREEGFREGRAQGKRDAAIALVLSWLRQHLGTVDPDLQIRIEQLSFNQLTELATVALNLSSQADLKVWLDHQ